MANGQPRHVQNTDRYCSSGRLEPSKIFNNFMMTLKEHDEDKNIRRFIREEGN